MITTQRGLSLLELLITLVIGLFLLGALSSIYLSNQQTFKQIENLASINENARTTFELLSTDIREVGGTHCGARLPTSNILNVRPVIPWWANWAQNLKGYEGHQEFSAKAFGNSFLSRVKGTDAVVLLSGSTAAPSNMAGHNHIENYFTLNTSNHGLRNGDIVIACNLVQSTIFQITNVDHVGGGIFYYTNHGQLIQPGNCRGALGLSVAPPHDCSTAGSVYSFNDGGFISHINASAWYIGYNDSGGTSLYRITLINMDGLIVTSNEEIIENVINLQIKYLETNVDGSAPVEYIDAHLVNDWSRVIAVRLHPTYRTKEAVGVDGNYIERTLPFVVSIRTRLL